MDTSRLEVTLFGDHGFFVDGERIAFPSTKVAALGYYLAAAGRAHTREALAALLWPDYDSAGAKKNLRAAIYHLRKQLDDWLVVSRQTAAFVDDGALRIDSRRFETLLAQAAQLSSDDAAVVPLLEEAVARYQGEFLQGFHTDDADTFDAWLDIERQRHRQMALQARSALLHHAMGAANTLLGIVHATELLALDPLHEEGHRCLMLLLAQDNRQSAALAQYERCKQLLWDELGVEPDEETLALAERIRNGELSGLRFALPARPRRLPHNLPGELTPLVGRERELAQIVAMLNDTTVRLITLTGSGGVGKSRLAIGAGCRLVETIEAREAAIAENGPAERTQDAAADGVYFVRLAGIEPGDDARLRISAAIAETLQVDTSSSDDLTTRLGQVLSERRHLLILDNFEQIQQEAGLLVDLLQQAPTLKMLVTSRAHLNVRGEQVVALEGLALPDEDDGAAIRASAAAGLFIAAAASVSPGFTPEEAELAAIARTCRLVQGLPLAIELAASWVRLLPCAEIARELERNLDFLDSTMPDLPARHRSLRAVFDQSWRLLADEEQRVLRRLAFFRGGFTREAAATVAGASMATLLDLLEKSLIRRHDTEETQDVRYALPETIRQYAAEHLDATAEADQTAAASAAYYAGLLADLSSELRSGDQIGALDRLATEIENIRSLLRWADACVLASQPAALAFLAVSTGALFDFLDILGWFQEGVTIFGDAAANVEQLPTSPAHGLLAAKLRARQAWFTFHVGRHRESKATLLACLETLKQAGEPTEQMFVLNYLSAVLRHIGDYAAARRYLAMAQSIQDEHPDIYEAGITANILAQVAFASGDLEAARRHCEQALHFKRRGNDRRGRTYSLNYLGRIFQSQGELDLARRSFAESLDIAEELGDPRAIATAQQHLGAVALASGQLTGARRQFEISLDTYRQLGSLIETSVVLSQLGRVAVAQGQLTEAIEALQDAIQIASEIRSRPALLTALLGLSHLLIALEQPARAAPILEVVLDYPDVDPIERAEAIRLAGQAGLAPPQPDAPAEVGLDDICSLAQAWTLALLSLAQQIQ